MPWLFVLAAGAAQAAPECAALASQKLPKARIDAVRSVAVGDKLVLWTGAQTTPSPLAFCRVFGTALPAPGSSIGFEVWLPAAAAWNGKFMQLGNGGFAGAVPVPSLMEGLLRGYATAGTDGGHRAADGLDASWGLHRPELVVDFGWRAVRRTTLAVQRVVAKAYARAPKKNYFVGCSDGGRDAMMVAQRFPKDFDAIVAGAPALDWTGLQTVGARVHREVLKSPPPLTTAKLPAIQAAALAACSKGGKYVEDPLQCRFDPAVLQCAGEESNACLTPPQIDFVRTLYNGLREPTAGRWLPGLGFGGEAEPGNWDFWALMSPTNPIGNNQGTRSIAESHYRYLVREDPAFTLADLSDADIALAYRRWRSTLDAIDPDLSAFKARGGKLLHYHGWTDSAISPRWSIDYQRAVQQRLGDTSDFHRLFLVPGMNHCGGGAGPWQVDWLGVLEQWVEKGVAPDTLVATHPQTKDTQTLRPHGAR